MLDRLRRGLGTQSLEDSSERMRKQIRRGLDPFGLLRERDEPAAPAAESAVAEVPSAPMTTPPAVEKNVAAVPPTDPGIALSTIENLILETEQKLKDWPQVDSGVLADESSWRRTQADLRLLYLINGRSADAVRIIERLPPEEQEFWQSLMLAVESYRSSNGITHPELDETAALQSYNRTMSHLRDAERRLQPLSNLALERVSFCERIDGFGQTTPYPSADFDPGQRVLIYAEVRNFRSRLGDDGSYRSEFSAVLDFLRGTDDEELDTIRLSNILDECDSERTDYFHSYEVTVPALSGNYRLRIQVHDKNSGKTAETVVPFRVR